MTEHSKQELLSSVKGRYLKATREEKHQILNEFCDNTGYHRKHAIRILQTSYHRKSGKKRGRPQSYDSDFMTTVITIWELLGYPSGKRLAPVLLPTAEAMERHGENISLSQTVKQQLGNISPNTLNRRLKTERTIRRLNRGRSLTRHGSLLKSSVPIRITNWDLAEIGFMEMDTVAHCGDQLAGDFVYSLDMVEIATGWSEQVAVMGKSEAGIVKAIEEIKQGLPFDLKGLDSDTGSEFVNWHMVKWCKEHDLSFTRSRPYYKNDNAYVEQKNYTHIRKWLGYRRYDTKDQLKLINDLYRNELRLWNNFFLPVMKIKSKEKINNSVAKKKYDIAQTPCQRLMKSDQVSSESKIQLKKLYESLNPVKLKAAIALKLKRIMKS